MRQRSISPLSLLLLTGVLLLTACSTAGPATSDDSARVASSPTASAAAPDVSPSAATPSATSVADTPEPSPSPSPSFTEEDVVCGLHVAAARVYLTSLHEYTWMASVIAVGRVTHIGEPYVVARYGQAAYARDVEVSVETLVRGADPHQRTLNLRQYGGDVNDCPQYLGEAEYTLDARVLLFLSSSELSTGEPLLDPLGQNDGVWPVSSADMVRRPANVPGGPLPLAEAIDSMAAALAGLPPLGGTAYGAPVSLVDAPLQVPVPAGTPDPWPDDLGDSCDGLISGVEPQFTSATNLGWYSSLIVVGTVWAQGPAYVVSGGNQPVIATDYAVGVETLVRGDLPTSFTVSVRQLGGTVGDCTQTYEGDPAFAVGERVLLFLMPDARGPVGAAQHYPLGQLQGVWPITADNMVSNPRIPLGSEPRPLEEVIEELVIGLHGVPPSGPLPLDQLVGERDAFFSGSYQQWSGLSDEQQYAAREAAEADPRVRALLGMHDYSVTQAALWGPSAGPQPAAIIAFAFSSPATIEGEWMVRSYPATTCSPDALPEPLFVPYHATYTGVTEIHVLIRLNDDLFPVAVEAYEPFGKGGEQLLGERIFTSSLTEIHSLTCWP